MTRSARIGLTGVWAATYLTGPAINHGIKRIRATRLRIWKLASDTGAFFVGDFCTENLWDREGPWATSQTFEHRDRSRPPRLIGPIRRIRLIRLIARGGRPAQP